MHSETVLGFFWFHVFPLLFWCQSSDKNLRSGPVCVFVFGLISKLASVEVLKA